MNQSRDFSPYRFLAIIAVLFGAIVLPAFGQQEVDPTWFDPWVQPSPAVVQSAKPAAAIHRQRPTVKRVSLAPTAKVHAKRSAARPRPS